MSYREIVMYGEHGKEQVDSYLTLEEARKTVKEYRLSDPYHTYSIRPQFRTRFYVKPSGGAVIPAVQLKDHVKRLGAGAPFNVRTARQFGWSNQPDVVTFSAWDHEAKFVENKLQAMGFMVLVMEKDW